ncbi:class III poly(R)-hydroxyalkanoic acid synthase subunit PhaE [Chromatium weissei]|nr:class III poly(R)-hydroxyalkanoic acid synthase subunit PhaE [Chromatium weissei]
MSNDSFFNDDWLALQRKYWDNWTAMSQKAMGMTGTASPTTPWESALDHWWKAVSPAAPNVSKSFIDNMLEQGKVFFRLAETLSASSTDTNTNLGVTWWTQALEDMQKRFSGSLDENGNAAQRMMSFWEMPLDNWQRMMSSMSPIPGDMLRNVPHDHLKDHLHRALAAPGLGYTREEQGQYQDLMRCSLDYQAALQEYIGFYNQLNLKSIQRMAQRLQHISTSSDKPIDSARALYDEWVNCCEAVYANEVITPEYAKIHGHLVNAQMAMKKRMGIIVDENLGAMNMPTRSELRTVQDRLQETRRDNKQLRHRLHALEKQVAVLLGENTPALSTAIKTTVPVAKTPVRRKPAQPE